MEPPWKLLAHPGLGAAATLRSLPRRSQVSEIWILVTAAYKQRSAAPRQAAGRGLGAAAGGSSTGGG